MSFLEWMERLPDRMIPGLEGRSYALYVAWREVCHFSLSLVLLGISHLLFLFTGFNVPLAVFVLLVVVLAYLELYRHPKKYKQKPWKGILDCIVWLTPFVAYWIVV